MNYECQPDDFQFANSDNEYRSMWARIDRLYRALHWDDLCKIELEELFQKAFRLGYASPNHEFTAKDVQSAVKKWRDNGWFRYEHERDERYRTMYKTLRFGALFVCGGFVL